MLPPAARLTLLLVLPVGASAQVPEAQADTEADLEALVEDGLLPEEAQPALVELLQEGVDLATAPREVLATLPGLSRADVDALLRAREVGAADEAAQGLAPLQRALLGPFLGDAPAPSVRVRLATAFTPVEPLPPPGLLQLRLAAGPSLSAGLVLSATRLQPGGGRWVAARRALEVAAPAPALQLPRGYVRVALGGWEVLAGTYRVGFAQRLTLDTTGRPEPDGALPDVAVLSPGPATSACPLADAAGTPHCGEGAPLTPDYRWRDGFRGLAASVRDVALAPGVGLSASAFASLAPRTLAPSELYERARCEDPRSPSDACRAPVALLAGGGDVRLTRGGLPGLLDEATGGGHLALRLSPQVRLGLTGYVAAPLWSGEGAALDFQESSRYPEGGLFGAVGVDAELGLGPLTLLAEVARSFDRVRGRGGDVALVQRTLLSGPGEELELQLRLYGPDFDNPYARPPAAADEEEGLRARNEAGARLTLLSHRLAPWRLQGGVDAWRELRGGGDGEGAVLPHLSAWVRADGEALAGVTPTLQLEHAHREVPEGACGGWPCGTETVRATARLQLRPSRALALALQYRHALALLPGGGPRHGGRALLELAVRPLPALRLRTRLRWDAPDLLAPDSAAPGLSGALSLDWRGPAGLHAQAAYHLAPPARPGPVAPGAEHHLRLELEARW